MAAVRIYPIGSYAPSARTLVASFWVAEFKSGLTKTFSTRSAAESYCIARNYIYKVLEHGGQ